MYGQAWGYGCFSYISLHYIIIMDKIQTLLSQISLLSKKNNEILEIMGTRFNIFHILGVSHYENTHSTILAELLNPEGTHGLHNSFLKLFLDINHRTADMPLMIVGEELIIDVFLIKKLL